MLDCVLCKSWPLGDSEFGMCVGQGAGLSHASPATRSKREAQPHVTDHATRHVDATCSELSSTFVRCASNVQLSHPFQATKQVITHISPTAVVLSGLASCPVSDNELNQSTPPTEPRFKDNIHSGNVSEIVALPDPDRLVSLKRKVCAQLVHERSRRRVQVSHLLAAPDMK